jgi:hypothetical protein
MRFLRAEHLNISPENREQSIEMAERDALRLFAA